MTNKSYPRYRGFPIRIRQAGDLFRADGWNSFTGKWVRGIWDENRGEAAHELRLIINDRCEREIERFCTEMEKANG